VRDCIFDGRGKRKLSWKGEELGTLKRIRRRTAFNEREGVCHEEENVGERGAYAKSQKKGNLRTKTENLKIEKF